MNEEVTVVTGASGGIGEELAYCAARAGRKLMLVARSGEKLKEVAERVAKIGGKTAEIVVLDLGTPGAAETLARALKEKNLRVAELVNNAGYGLAGLLEKADTADQLGIVDLNVRTLTALTLRFLPEIIEAEGGVLNVASTAAFQPGPNMAIYYASKAYVLSFSEALWFEVKGRVRVTCLCPGPVPTQFSARANRGKRLRLMQLSMTSAVYVAEAGWRGFERGKRVVVPGVLNRISVFFTPFIPRRLLLPVVSRL